MSVRRRKKYFALALIEAIYFVLTKDDEKVKCKQRKSLASCVMFWVRDSFPSYDEKNPNCVTRPEFH